MAAGADGLGAAVDAVVSCDLHALSVDQLQSVLPAVDEAAQRLSGFRSLAAAELQRRTGGQLPTDDGRRRTVAGWLADATGDSAPAAGRLIRLGELLQDGLPLVAQTVLDGRLSLAKAEVLIRLVGKIDQAALAEAEPMLIQVAQEMDPIALGHYVRHQIAQWVEPALEDDEASATAKRYLKHRREADGSLWGSFRLPAGDAETVLTGLEPLARPTGAADSRSAAQRRADALVEVCEQVLRHGQLPDAGGQRPQLSYVLPADWAARQNEQQHCPDCRRCPEHAPPSFADVVAAGVPESHADWPAADHDAEAATSAASHRSRLVPPASHGCATAAWTGPQTRARLETVLCDARISRLLLDSLGQVRGLESLKDNITPMQRRALAGRDLGCAVRGCTRPPAMCDAHHLRARADGGATDIHNLVLLCRRHHVLWHLGKITLRHLHVPWVTHRSPSDAPPGAPPGTAAGAPPAPRRAPDTLTLRLTGQDPGTD
jgi:hypothetical protein